MAPFLIRRIACIPAPTTFIFGAGDFSPHIVPPHLLHHKRENHNRLKSLNYFRIRLLDYFRWGDLKIFASLKAGFKPFRNRNGMQFTRLLKKGRSEEHTSELQSLMRISYAVFCLTKKTQHIINAY